MSHKVSAKTPALANRLIGAQGEMKLRFETLLTPKDPKASSRRKAMMVLFVALFLLSYAVIVQPAYLPPEEDLTVNGLEAAYDVTDEFDEMTDQYFVYENGEYKLYIGGYYFGVIDEDSVKSDPNFNNIPILGGN